jgi:hypothetical protein
LNWIFTKRSIVEHYHDWCWKLDLCDCSVQCFRINFQKFGWRLKNRW